MVEENFFFRCDGEAEIVSNKSCENVYRGNIFYESRGALVMRHGDRCLVEGNFFFGNGVGETGGIRLVGSGHVVRNNYLEGLRGSDFRAALALMAAQTSPQLNGYARVENAVIVHNTWVDCHETWAWAVGLGTDSRSQVPRNSVVANNLVVAREGRPLANAYGSPTGFTVAGNLRQATGDGWVFPANSFASGEPVGARGADGVWRPLATGPQRDAAVALAGGALAEDAEGQPRADGLPDIGADEWSTAAVRRRVAASPWALQWGPAWLRAPARTQAAASTGALRYRPSGWPALGAVVLESAAAPEGPWSVEAPPAADPDGWISLPVAGPSPNRFWRLGAALPAIPGS